MPKSRLGVALLLPPQAAAEVDGLRRALGDGSLGRIPAHLTLVPPVNVGEARLPEALALLRGAAAATSPFTVEMGPPATFLPDNPVLYLGVGGAAAEVHALRHRLLEGPLARPPSWPFVPHVTLADDGPVEVIEAGVLALGRYRAQARFDRVHLLRQRPDRVWEPMADAVFGPPAVIGRGGLPLEITVSELAEDEARPPTRPFVVTARREGVTVGTAMGTVAGPLAVVDRLAVEPEHRRQGVGSHLLAAVESLAAESGCRAVLAECAPDDGAQAFLRNRGWTEAGLPSMRRTLAPT